MGVAWVRTGSACWRGCTDASARNAVTCTSRSIDMLRNRMEGKQRREDISTGSITLCDAEPWGAVAFRASSRFWSVTHLSRS